MKQITQDQVLEIFKATKGTMFTATFTKKNGDLRTMNCRTGVTKHLTGVGAKYDAADYDLFRVYDLKSKGYRTINLLTVTEIKANGSTYEVV